MRKPFQSPVRMKNSSYYIAPVEDRTHDLPHTVASNMGNNVVNYYDLSFLSMSVMGSKKQFGWGWVGGWGELLQVYFGIV